MWNIAVTTEYLDWFKELDDGSRQAIVRNAMLLSELGPNLGRPYVDTLKGSLYKNLKELRAKTGNHVYRICFIFDEQRNALLLIGGDKKGETDKSFYRRIIPEAEAIYERVKRKKEEEKHDGNNQRRT